jgi:hypothetical protein
MVTIGGFDHDGLLGFRVSRTRTTPHGQVQALYAEGSLACSATRAVNRIGPSRRVADSANQTVMQITNAEKMITAEFAKKNLLKRIR